MACKEDTNAAAAQDEEATEICKSELESRRFQVDSLEAELLDVKRAAYLDFGSEEDARKELGLLSGRVRATAVMLRYLRSKARLLAIPDHLPQVELKGLDFLGSSSSCEEDGAYTSEMLQSIEMVTGVLESLVGRVTAAESETAVQKEMALLGEEELSRKTVQIENLSLKLQEMERFAHGTNGVLSEMRERIEELVEETMRQREKAVENEEELCRVKREFESLKSYVSTFTSVRETLLSSERQFKTIEELFERLVTKTTQLEGEKAQKEVEVQKLMEENVKLTALLDKKEAQLLALNEQCKVMALSASDI
ncbi:kinectin-related [Raphanus sativus]|uniref:WEB family protein At1g65010, chloroplastic n=1 Tax=Raphanus sativus TaxID=3726 RepID=A0A6J0NMD4_RAPSA|nr:putative WEB family protein At1g65010, chloroplastic [Raphanus sativus]KAJ4897100.1 kinectin-related [Raphanus sativus]